MSMSLEEIKSRLKAICAENGIDIDIEEQILKEISSSESGENGSVSSQLEAWIIGESSVDLRMIYDKLSKQVLWIWSNDLMLEEVTNLSNEIELFEIQLVKKRSQSGDIELLYETARRSKTELFKEFDITPEEKLVALEIPVYEVISLFRLSSKVIQIIKSQDKTKTAQGYGIVSVLKEKHYILLEKSVKKIITEITEILNQENVYQAVLDFKSDIAEELSSKGIKGPLFEIEYWSLKEKRLNELILRLESHDTEKLIRIFESLQTQKDSVSEHLTKFFVEYEKLNYSFFEAKDNSKFLSSVKNYFLILFDVKTEVSNSTSEEKATEGDDNILNELNTESNQDIAYEAESDYKVERKLDIIKVIFSSLAIIWLTSRYFNTDQMMFAFLKRFRIKLCYKIQDRLNLHMVATTNLSTTLKIIHESLLILQKFKEEYFASRDKIEKYGTMNRWEFDKKELFEELDWMISVFKQLQEVFGSILNYTVALNLLSDHISTEVEELEIANIKIEELLALLEQGESLDLNNRHTWSELVVEISEKVGLLDDNMASLVTIAFKEIKTSKQSLELSHGLQVLDSKSKAISVVNQQLTRTLKYFRNDIMTLKESFEKERGLVCLHGLTKTISKSIWLDSLFGRTRKTLNELKPYEETLVKLDDWVKSLELFLGLCKDIRAAQKDVCKQLGEDPSSLEYDFVKLDAFNSITSGSDAYLTEQITSSNKENTGFNNYSPPTGEEIKRISHTIKINPLSLTREKLFEKDYLYLNGKNKQLTNRFWSLRHKEATQDRRQLRVALNKIEDIKLNLSPSRQKRFQNSLYKIDLSLKQFSAPKSWATLNFDTMLDTLNQRIEAYTSLSNQFGTYENELTNISSNKFLFADWAESNESRNFKNLEDFLTTFEHRYEQDSISLVAGIKEKQVELVAIWNDCFLNKCQQTAVFNDKNIDVWKAYVQKIEEIMYNVIMTYVLKIFTELGFLFDIKQKDINYKTNLMIVKSLGEESNSFSQLFSVTENEVDKLLSSCENIVFSKFNQLQRFQVQESRLTLTDCPKEETYVSYIKQNTSLQQVLSGVENSLKLLKVEMNIDLHTKYALFCLRKIKLQVSDIDSTNISLERVRNVVNVIMRLQSKLDIIKDNMLNNSFLGFSFLQIDCDTLVKQIETKLLVYKEGLKETINKYIQREKEEVFNYLTNCEEKCKSNYVKLEEIQVVHEMIIDLKNSRESIRTLGNIVDSLMYVSLNYLSEETTACIIVESLEDMFEAKVKALFSLGLQAQALGKQFVENVEGKISAFKGDVKNLRDSYDISGPKHAYSDPKEMEEAVTEFEKFTSTVKTFTGLERELFQLCDVFNLDAISNDELRYVTTEISQVKQVIGLCNDFLAFKKRFLSLPWSNFNVKTTLTELDALDSSLDNYEHLYTYAIFKALKKGIHAEKDTLSVLKSIRVAPMKQRHWNDIEQELCEEFKFDEHFIIKQLLGPQFSAKQADISNIVYGAQQEQKLHQQVKQIVNHWLETKLVFSKYERSGVTVGVVLTGCEDLLQEIEDHLLTIQGIGSSRYIKHFEQEVEAIEKTLNGIYTTICVWQKLQTKWLYLESIYIGAEDIKVQLPKETEQFTRLSANFVHIQEIAKTADNAETACSKNGEFLVETLENLIVGFEKSQKSLSDYLHLKRGLFPRFFFLSDDELLSALGSVDPVAIQEHMLKLYDNTKKLLFSKNKDQVTGIESSEGESVVFDELINTNKSVEVWMKEVDKTIHESVRFQCKSAVFYKNSMDRLEWLKNNLGMATILASQIWWTAEVEESFRQYEEGESKKSMLILLEKLNVDLNQLVDFVRQDLTSHMRKKVNTALIIDVHARDIVSGFVKDSIQERSHFAWESQLRFYWEYGQEINSLSNAVIRQCMGTFNYGYEYLGLNGRLVITNLTDRCYMTITTGLYFFLGTAPSGPAGTGKTETTKDLAKAMGIICYVINCGEGLDYKAMGSIFSGLGQVGAWGCFDEFNRINIEVLSVVATQIENIQNALRGGRDTCDIGMGSEIKLNPKIGLYITMNPGYAGRTELPDNLKALFRPVTMIVPDLYQICEIMLFSEGFLQAKVLAKKMTTLYKLAQGQLSKQFHYDFGLRALRSVLVSAGALKREHSYLDESVVLMRALRDSNMPKFVSADVPLFQGLLNDLFPGAKCPRVTFKALKHEVEQEMKHNFYGRPGHLSYDLQVDKAIQIYEIMLTRHTCMVVGPTNGGKSTNLEIIKKAQMITSGKTINTAIINPKAQGLPELYGVLDPLTRDWEDGILSCLFRQMNKQIDSSENLINWLIFDGDVDALWIENMNSVMDDNRLLTLPNGERIRLQPHCHILMETYDLQYASPATISRCGMIYIDATNLNYKCVFQKWLCDSCSSKEKAILSHEELQKLPKEGFLTNLFEEVFVPLIDLIFSEKPIKGLPFKKLNYGISLTEVSIVKQFCTIFDAQYQEYLLIHYESLAEDDEIDLEPYVLEGIFCFSLLWSMAGPMNRENKEYFLQVFEDIGPKSCPSGSFRYCFDIPTKTWKTWESILALKMPDQEESCSSSNSSRLFIQTPVTQSFITLFSLVMRQNVPLLCKGEAGSSKTLLVQQYLERQESSKYSSLMLNFSSRTSGKQVLLSLESSTEKKSKLVYAPLGHKHLNVFIDDLNMPVVDEYGTQQPIAFLLFLIAHKGFFTNGEEKEFRKCKNLNFIAAANFDIGSTLDPRFLSCFSIFDVNAGDEDTVINIFSKILKVAFNDTKDELDTVISQVCANIFTAYNLIRENFPATPKNFQYLFSLKDLSRVFDSLCTIGKSIFIDCKENKDMASTTISLACHEVTRCFTDRFANVSDLEKVLSDLHNTFNVDPTKELFAFKRDLTRDYGKLESVESIKDDCEVHMESLMTSNASTTRLVFFKECIEQLLRLVRILTFSGSHCLFIGVGGTGKQSITKLCAHIKSYGIFEISLSKNYNQEAFQEDLKLLFGKALHKPTVFLLKDSDIVEESFLELINSILSLGVIKEIYQPEDKERVINMTRTYVNENNIIIPLDKDSLWNWFCSRCKANLHIVLALSPSGDLLAKRCRDFPALLSACHINYFHPWSKSAMLAVATETLHEEKVLPEHRENVKLFLVDVHESVIIVNEKMRTRSKRHNYVTPKNYLEFISNFHTTIDRKTKENKDDMERLTNGLSKLKMAEDAVSKMKEELALKTVVVNEKTASCTKMITVINEKKKIASEKEVQAEDNKKQLMDQAVVIEQEKSKADKRLEEALPLLDNAAKALDALDKNDITEIKGFANPPLQVMNVCSCALILKPIKGISDEVNWANCKTMLANSNFLNSLKTYNKDGMTDRQMKKVKQYFRDPSFNIQSMEKISIAGSGLFTWVDALVKYFDVAKNIVPLKARVKQLEKDKCKGEEELESTLEILDRLKKDLNKLNKDFTVAKEELTNLKVEAQLMQKRLNAANRLVSALNSEKARWTTELASLTATAVKLIGNSLLGASFLSYLGIFPAEYRTELQTCWYASLQEKKIPMNEIFSPIDFLISESEIQQLGLEGLPTDKLSVENAILTLKASKFPLCIDPQQQALEWIMKREKDNKLVVKRFSDANYMQNLELAIQLGNPFVFVDVTEDIDPIITPIIEKRVFEDNGNLKIKLGDKIIDWDINFKMILICKIANPHFSPETVSRFRVVNYSLTVSGLADQLLIKIVRHEKPELEERFKNVVLVLAQGSRDLSLLEADLLKALANSKGNILDDESLLETLETTKSKSGEISKQIKLTNQAKIEIQSARSIYKNVAQRGSELFFVIVSLSLLNPMYQTSLLLYLSTFSKALDTAQEDEELQVRVESLIDEITLQAYFATCVGLFKDHKLLYSFQTALSILQKKDDGKGEFDQKQIDFLLFGTPVKEQVRSEIKWLSDPVWNKLLYLESIEDSLSGLTNHMLENTDDWLRWYKQALPEIEPLPFSKRSENSDAARSEVTKISPFAKVLLMFSVRSDRTVSTLRLFIKSLDFLGPKYIEPPILDYKLLYRQSKPNTPIIFINSPGADPSRDVRVLCEELGKSLDNFKSLSLGQGQEQIAEDLVQRGAKEGFWVMLQNCHLLKDWLNRLDYQISSIIDGEIHEDFRLWLTTNQCSYFPLGILQKSLRVVIEPPEGLRLNLRNTYSKLSETEFEEEETANLIFILCFVHGILQERRKYGKLGFNVNYDFSFADYHVSYQLLLLYTDSAQRDISSGELPWPTLRYLIGDAMYGGRVSDNYDRRILRTYFQEYFGSFVFDKQDKFRFRTGDISVYLPTLNTIKRHLETVDNIPLDCKSDIFGLHLNADISFLERLSKEFVENSALLQPGKGITQDDSVQNNFTGMIQEYLKLIPSNYDVNKLQRGLTFCENTGNVKIPSPTEVVLLQELERFNFLLEKMRSTLKDVVLAINGTISLSPIIEDTTNCLLSMKIPTVWQKLIPSSQKKLNSWFSHFQQRIKQYNLWIAKGELKTIWLGGLHVPEAYLAAIIQKACRANNWPLDRAFLFTTVATKEQIKGIQEDEDACLFSGIYLEGASWDADKDVIVNQNWKELIEELPLLIGKPVLQGCPIPSKYLITPVYVTQERRNAMGVGLVFEIHLKVSNHHSFWILQGLAACLNDDS